MNIRRIKIIAILLLVSLFSLQIFSFAYESGKKKGRYLFKEKMAALKVRTILAEREGKEEEIKAQYYLLEKACEETANTPFVNKRTKRK